MYYCKFLVSRFTFSPFQKHFYVTFFTILERTGYTKNFSISTAFINFTILWIILHFLCELEHSDEFAQTYNSWGFFIMWVCWCINNDGRKPITCILESNSTSILYMGTAGYLLIVLKERCVKSFHMPLLICLHQKSHMIYIVKNNSQ